MFVRSFVRAVFRCLCSMRPQPTSHTASWQVLDAVISSEALPARPSDCHMLPNLLQFGALYCLSVAFLLDGTVIVQRVEARARNQPPKPTNWAGLASRIGKRTSKVSPCARLYVGTSKNLSSPPVASG